MAKVGEEGLLCEEGQELREVVYVALLFQSGACSLQVHRVIARYSLQWPPPPIQALPSNKPEPNELQEHCITLGALNVFWRISLTDTNARYTGFIQLNRGENSMPHQAMRDKGEGERKHERGPKRETLLVLEEGQQEEQKRRGTCTWSEGRKGSEVVVPTFVGEPRERIWSPRRQSLTGLTLGTGLLPVIRVLNILNSYFAPWLQAQKHFLGT
ncbi:hypothetical protein JOM56_009899 [Amanita muscaria]